MKALTPRVVWAVIKREYLQRVRSKWFVISTVAAPLLMAGLVFAPFLLSGDSPSGSQSELVIVDQTGQLAAAVQAQLRGAGWAVRVAEDPGSEQTISDLLQAANDEEIRGFLVLDEETLATGAARYTSRNRPSSLRTATLQQAVVQTLIGMRMAEAGIDLSALSSAGIEVDILTTEEVETPVAQYGAAYAGAFVLYFTVLLYAVAVMRSVLEEKTNRVVEIVLSSMRPFELMLGKILGVGAVGLTQIAVWVTAAVLLSKVGVPTMVAARPEFASLGSLEGVLPGPGFAFLFLLFFLCGFFIYAGMYAAVGAMTNSEQEAQQAQAPMVILMVVPIVILPGVLQNPDATASVLLSLIPFFSPVLMFGRAIGGAAPIWQVALSVALMVATLLAVAWIAGRIYRVGILMSGKRPTLPELWRWVRQG